MDMGMSPHVALALLLLATLLWVAACVRRWWVDRRSPGGYRSIAEEAEEWLLVVKTTAQAYERVEQAIKELHSYEVAECVCLAVEDGSADYLTWIGESVG